MHGVFMHVRPIRLILLTTIVMSGALFERPHFAQAGEPVPIVTTDVKNKKDRVTVCGNAQRAIVSITCPAGIGNAVIQRTADTWPKQLALRLNLRGLEQVSILNLDASLTLRGSILSHGNHRQLLKVAKGKRSTKVGQDSPFFTKIEAFDRQSNPTREIPLVEGYFQLEIPAAMLNGNPKDITIRWIDFFRS